MEDSPRFNPQSENRFFVDGRSMRPRVPGTVAFASARLDPAAHGEAEWARPYLERRAAYLADDTVYYAGRTGPGEDDFADEIPVAVTRELLLRGQERFGIYCAACHGYAGDGQGMVGRRWLSPVPSFHEERFIDPAQRTGKDGYIFHIARNGLPDEGGGFYRMPPYGHALDAADTWAVVAYVRALQEARLGTIDDVPAAEREALLSARQAIRANGGGQ